LSKKIKSVVEIGPGLSTELMDRLGIHVLSYETNPLFLTSMKRKVGKGITVKQWNGFWLPKIDVSKYELALIDGPAGGVSRGPAYKAIANSGIKYVACHDSKREEDKVLIDMYFREWKEVARTDESVQGILILER